MLYRNCPQAHHSRPTGPGVAGARNALPSRRVPRGSGTRKGTAAVEMAVLAPFLTVIFLVTVDFARILYYTITIENCIHNGVLFGSQSFDNQNQQWIGSTQYWQGPNSTLVSGQKTASELDGTTLNPALADSNVSVSSGTDKDGNSVTLITITYQFNLIGALPGVSSQVSIKRTGQMRIAPATPS